MKNSFVKRLILALTLALVLCLSALLIACGSVSGEQNSGNVNNSSESSSSLNEQSSSTEECEHQFVNEGGKDATCTENGYAILRCSLCGEVRELEVVNKGHNYVDGVCSVCGEVEDTQVATPNKYFEFTLLDNDTYEIKAKNANNMPAEVVIPSSYEGKPVTAISNTAFFLCESLTSIEIPNSITSIGDYAFYVCSSLTTIVIPNSITSICRHAFDACKSLQTIYYKGTQSEWYEIAIDNSEGGNSHLIYAIRYYYSENNPAEDGNYWHYNANGEIEIWNNLPVEATPNEYFEFTLLDNDTYEIKAKDVNNMPASVVIPSSYEGKPITSIGEGAFYYKSLKSIEIPNSVTSIGYCAFGRCSSLTLIIIPDSVTSIGENAFYGCDSLNYNIEDDLKYLGNKNNPYLYLAGTESTEITTAKINKNCKLIGETAFYGCSSLTSVEIPNSVTTIGEAAFSSCRSLTSIVIPDSVTEIEIEAFANCHSLTSIVIPNSVTSIGEDAFSSCRSLTSIVIPDSVTSIGEDAFRGCYDLETVYYKGTQSEWDKITIGSSNSKLTNATRYYYSESEPTESGNYWHYNANGEIEVW